MAWKSFVTRSSTPWGISPRLNRSCSNNSSVQCHLSSFSTTRRSTRTAISRCQCRSNIRLSTWHRHHIWCTMAVCPTHQAQLRCLRRRTFFRHTSRCNRSAWIGMASPCTSQCTLSITHSHRSLWARRVAQLRSRRCRSKCLKNVLLPVLQMLRCNHPRRRKGESQSWLPP